MANCWTSSLLEFDNKDIWELRCEAHPWQLCTVCCRKITQVVWVSDKQDSKLIIVQKVKCRGRKISSVGDSLHNEDLFELLKERYSAMFTGICQSHIGHRWATYLPLPPEHWEGSKDVCCRWGEWKLTNRNELDIHYPSIMKCLVLFSYCV